MAKEYDLPTTSAHKRFARRQESVSFRPSTDTRELLEKGAREAGHSLSSEIDMRLRMAYWDTDRLRSVLETLFGGELNLATAFLISRVITGIENLNESRWLESATTNEQVACGLALLLAGSSRPDAAVDFDAQLLKSKRETEIIVAAAQTRVNGAGGFWWPLGQGTPPVRQDIEALALTLLDHALTKFTAKVAEEQKVKTHL